MWKIIRSVKPYPLKLFFIYFDTIFNSWNIVVEKEKVIFDRPYFLLESRVLCFTVFRQVTNILEKKKYKSVNHDLHFLIFEILNEDTFNLPFSITRSK